mmetsp:Transcript_64051/g.113949  ORF Transcript_64051/g.113949 Transcript_64051/m.113949 type:complete len:119 (-) Transcript_64051:205-561(-)
MLVQPWTGLASCMASSRLSRIRLELAAQVAQECSCDALKPKTALQMATATVAEVDRKSYRYAPKKQPGKKIRSSTLVAAGNSSLGSCQALWAASVLAIRAALLSIVMVLISNFQALAS